MLTDAKVIALVATAKPDEALVFYRDRLGLELIEDSPYAIVFRAGDTMLRLQRVESFEPHPFTSTGWDVADIGATVAALNAQGITMMTNPYVELDPAGIWTAPDGTRVAWFNDPDGNVLSLTQFA